MPKPSAKLNRMIHAVFGEVADHFEILGTDQKIVLRVAPTPLVVKEYFKQNYVLGKTSQCTSQELASHFDRFLRNLNKVFIEHGLDPIEVDNPDFKEFMQILQNKS